MLIAIFGESCTGKSTLANALAQKLDAEIYTGKDFLRLAKSENIARLLFQKKLNAAVTGENIIYVIAEKEHLAPLPEGAIRVLTTADLELIKARFTERMRGKLPEPVAAMLERKHGCFNEVTHDIHVVAGKTDLNSVIKQITKEV